MSTRYVVQDTQAYDRGEVVKAFDTKQFTMLQVQKDSNGNMCQVISNLTPYTEAHLCFSGANVLNLSSEATRQAVKTGHYQGIHYSSSGARDKEGNVLTLSEQIKQGLARMTEVIVRIKDEKLLGSTHEYDYDIVILSDNANKLVPLE